MQTYVCVDFDPVTLYASPAYDDERSVETLSVVAGCQDKNPSWIQIGPHVFVEREKFRLETRSERISVRVPALVEGGVTIPEEREAGIVVCSAKDRLLMEYNNKCAVKQIVSTETMDVYHMSTEKAMK